METKSRINYIDNIKIAITFLVVAHHAGQPYGNTGGVWLLEDTPKLEWLSSFFFINAAYMMGFFFFVSGYFMYFSVARKSTAVFLKDRFRRLGIPLLFFMFVVFVPLSYMMADTRENYFVFLYDTYFHKPPLAVGHLWFVASLLAYTFIFMALKKPLLKSRELVWQPWYPLVFIMVLAAVNYGVRLKYPIDHWETWLIPIEVAHLPQYLSLFLLGVVANKNNWLEQLQPKTGWVYFAVGVSLFCIRETLNEWVSEAMAEPLVETFLCVGIIMGSLVGFKKWGNSTHAVVQFFSNCSYGIYLFHVLLVIAFQLLFQGMGMPTLLKFIAVTLLGITSAAVLTNFLKKNKGLNKIL
ncbi:acyltransferase [Flavobacterium sedimenticola]|uniref:Acyltransferase family protein n=1 Tax=Flavobacterium sedimenticola TaxID=3043286 RepID=A0ABT6XSV5_9FLAO|nr:acyltransferase family protein [Flavobacterium sedimenticola]MDI9258156.1 acyltransferase family protein [Flavobacterium sedimenticola]